MLIHPIIKEGKSLFVLVLDKPTRALEMDLSTQWHSQTPARIEYRRAPLSSELFSRPSYPDISDISNDHHGMQAHRHCGG